MISLRPIAIAGAALLGMALLQPSAGAADREDFEVVGTSDVFDSYLVQTVLEPGFEQAYPQYDLKYVSKGTSAAIAWAKAGTASAMIVHAASLENQFVADGYSAEPYGRAIFWGDFVLLGPANDPAGVLDGASHDVVTAFEKIAAAGEDGEANFVSRGSAPGTTVQERAIWALTDGVTTCTMSSADGGGSAPTQAETGNCPPLAQEASYDYPDWYHVTGLTQAPNILAGDVCNFDKPTGVDNNCYVFTDRGTFQYLLADGQIDDLQMVTRDNAGTARGTETVLANWFHAYALNPAKFPGNTQINKPAAIAFLNWITSPAVQKRIGQYLGEGGDPAFIPNAAPKITATVAPTAVKPGTPITVTGQVVNVTPGTPALNNVEVKLMARPSASLYLAPTKVATARTDATGRYTLKYVPTTASMTYTVATDSITKIQIPTLDPPFGDILAPGSVLAGGVDMRSTATLKKPKAKGKKVTLKGKLAPVVTGKSARLRVYAVKTSKAGKKQFKQIATRKLRAGKTSYQVTVKRPKGKWTIKVEYVNNGTILPGLSGTKKVKVG